MYCDWDAFDVYLFDIDGTLLNCRDAVHYFAFCDTLSWVVGRPVNLDGVTTHGSTDIGILGDALHLAGVDEAQWRPHLPELQHRVSEGVLNAEHDLDPEVLPGVLDVLQHLRDRGALLGLATGNLEPVGWAKLRRAGLAEFFRFGSFSTDAPSRAEIFAAAVNKAHALRGPDAAICAVGDTSADIRAAQASNLPVIAVATGIYSEADLSACGPTWCVSNFLVFTGQRKT